MSGIGKIQFVNTVRTAIRVRNEKGYEHYHLPMFASHTVAGRVGEKWIAEIIVGDRSYELASGVISERETGIRVTDEKLFSAGVATLPPLARGDCLTFSNRGSFAIDVMFIDCHGREHLAGSLPAYQQESDSPLLALQNRDDTWYAVYPRALRHERLEMINPGRYRDFYRFTPSLEGQTVIKTSVHPPKTFNADELRPYPLDSEKPERYTNNQLTKIEIDNTTHCTLHVFQVPKWSYVETLAATIDARDFGVIEAFVQEPLIIREARSGILLGVVRATRGINRLVIDNSQLVSQYAQPEQKRSMMIVNKAPYPVDWVWVKSDGTETEINGVCGRLQPDAETELNTFVGHVFKFRPVGLDQVIEVLAIGEQNEARFEITNRLYREEVAATTEQGNAIRLRPGEMGLYENKNFCGRVKIYHSAIPDLKRFGDLDNQVSSVRVGPATALTCFEHAAFSGKSLEITLDEPDLSVKGFDNQISSLQRVHISAASALGITSRSACTHDYFSAGGSDRHEKVAVFRSTIHFPRNVSCVDIWAASPLTIDVAGLRHAIDPVRPARISPDMLGNIVVAVRADAEMDGFGLPALLLRANTMHPGERIVVYPDLAAHKALLDLPPGELAKPEIRKKLGVKPDVSERDLNAVQDTVQKLAGAIGHTYNFTPHGVHHDRVVDPENLGHPHWMLDFTAQAGAAALQPLSSASVMALTKGAREIQVSANNRQLGQSFFGDLFSTIGHGVSDLTHVVIHTVEKGLEDIGETVVHVGEDLIDAVETTGKDMYKTVVDVGEDLVEGNFSGAWNDLKHDVKTVGNDLRSGGENLAGDLLSGAGQLAGDLATGIGRAIRITLTMGGELITFVLDHTGIVGQLIKGLFEKIGVALHKLVDLILDAIGWNDVLHTQACLASDFRQHHVKFDGAMQRLQQSGDKFFHDSEAAYSDAIERLVRQAPNPFDPQHRGLAPQPQAHSKAREQLDWFLSKLLGYLFPAFGGNPMAELVSSLNPMAVSPLQELQDTLEEIVDTRDGKAKKALLAVTHFSSDVLDHPTRAPADFYQALLHLVEAVGDGAIEVGNAMFNQALAYGEGGKRRLMEIANTPVHIPLLSDIFEDETRPKWTILDLTALVIALPATSSAKAAGFKPFEERRLAASSEEDQAFKTDMKSYKSWGAAYAGVHMACTLFDPLSDLAQRSVFKTQKRHPDLEFGVGPADIFGAFSLLLGGFGLISGSPVGSPTAQSMKKLFEQPNPADAGDVMKNANYLSHRIWHLQFVMWLLKVANTLQGQAQHLEGSAVKALFNTNKLAKTRYYQENGSDYVTSVVDIIYVVLGAFHLVDFCLLSDAEAAKKRAIEALPEASRSLEQKEFLRWAQDNGIEGKTVGNLCETFPEIISTVSASPFIVESSGGDSLLAAAAIDVLSHPVQAGIYLDRAKKLWLF